MIAGYTLGVGTVKKLQTGFDRKMERTTISQGLGFDFQFSDYYDKTASRKNHDG
ncbi:hypothetical protein [Bacillus sp. mrc49]|uniref:hypothetical protein n=1 Tax=Bacillus sp. mrc49 TaxID=2054913 RepID=UPI0012FE70B3|nr:hypothetical protein [Bacillus sp. mrc49]